MQALLESHEYLFQELSAKCLPTSHVLPNEEVERVSDISYKQFHDSYLITNKPCIIVQCVTENWRSRRDWVTREKKPNFAFLSENFGSSVVPVANCAVREYNAQQKNDMSFNDYLKYWEDLSSTKDNKECDNLYLKDWHFMRQNPNYEAYRTPEYFHSDWLNECCEKEENDDYKFVYMGPKGTWTPLHADVFGSYSWSVNICGRKRWLLFPPGQEKLLKDQNDQLLYLLEEADLSRLNVAYLEVFQEAGEAIFVPSGWHHQVWNVEDTISINHNWFNACNIFYIWRCLQKAALEVEKEISDCKEFEGWEEQLQIILKAHHGLNYEDFVQLLNDIADSRLKFLHSLNPPDFERDWEQIFDIISIQKLHEKLLSDNKMNQQLTHQVEKCNDAIIKCIAKLLDL